MTNTASNNDNAGGEIKLHQGLRFLTPEQISMIDEMLDRVSPYGEVSLRVKNGKLKLATQSKSFDALKLQRRSTKDKIRIAEK